MEMQKIKCKLELKTRKRVGRGNLSLWEEKPLLLPHRQKISTR